MIYNAYSDSPLGLGGVTVISAGHIFAKKGRKICRPKGREDWLLFYVGKGKERFFLDQESDAEAGAFIIFRPGERQDHVSLSDQTGEYYYVHFDADDDFDSFGLESSRVYSAASSSMIQDAFETIVNELQSKRPLYDRVSAAELLYLFGLLARRTAIHSDPNVRNADRISLVIQKMNREYYGNQSLEEYAALCHMSKYHFLRVFRKITGSSPISYRNQIRLEHAKELLDDGSILVSELSARLGFSSPSYFADAFKKKWGMTPVEYRKRVREESYRGI